MKTNLAISPEDIHAAAVRLHGRVHRTPMLSSSTLDELAGAKVLAKGEHLQRSGSFKIRGALNRLSLLTIAERERGVVAFSSGNHAQGVALAAHLTGIDATIVMPADAPTVKKQATAAYGARIVEYDRYREDREQVAAAVAGERGSVLVPPFNDAHVIAGQGTCGLEIMEDWPDVDVVVVPVGGGGLASGIAVAVKSVRPDVRVVGVEPAAADDARQSLAAGHVVRIDQPRTVADGVATPAVGDLTFPILQTLLEEIVTVSEEEILRAQHFVVTRMKQFVEPTGALTTAALLFDRVRDITGRRVVTVFCGGNGDVAMSNDYAWAGPTRTASFGAAS
jgi:threo-3-hydroxy-L-aspartate ammonia-lyase